MSTVQAMLQWLLASPLRAGLAAAALALSRLFDFFGAALLALVALRRGWAAGAQVFALALLVIALASHVGGFGMALPLAVGGLWLPVLILSLALRDTGSLALMMQTGVAVAGLALGGWYLVESAPLETMRSLLEVSIVPVLASVDGAQALTGERLDALTRLAPGLIAAGGYTAAVLAVLVGRWWQATVFNPGGFQRDFHRLRQGKTATALAGALVLAALFGGNPVLTGFAMAGVVAMVLQGVAMAHGVVAAARQPVVWLWGMYGLLFLLPMPATVLLAIAGGIDNWMDFRRLAGQDAESNATRDRKGE